MKLKRTLAVLAAAGMATTTVCALTGCNDDTVDVPKGTVTITALMEGNANTGPAVKAMIEAYNNGQGKTDGVFVKADIMPNDSLVAGSQFTKSVSKAYNVISISDNQNNLQQNAIKKDGKRAPNGYLLNLQPYADKDEDFKKNTINPDLLNWWSMSFNANAKPGAGAQKHVIGAGQPLMGIPYAAQPQLNWYNKKLFATQNINIISVPEEELTAYNTAHNSNIKPHGYAEYLNSPYDGAQASQNLAGKTVYKVFNNAIGMNWEEQRVFFKYFAKAYNTDSPTQHAFSSEYWFNYGWSVGGDVMGFNGTDYDFTLMDERPNYIVTKDATVINGSTYNAGEIVRYEDRVNGIEKAATKPANIYAIESQYNAVKEFISLQCGTGVTVDGEYKGYGLTTYYDIDAAGRLFDTEQLAMLRNSAGDIPERLSRPNAADYDVCACETYREYVGGSTYQKDGQSGFANEYLKVIGETYDGEVYTGDLKVVDGTPIVGSTTTTSITRGLVIPACSDPDKYQAAWDFISWVATDGQEYMVNGKSIIPVAKDVLFSDKFAYSKEVNGGKNNYSLANLAYNCGRGDWGYFESGSWVTSWAVDFNDNVRHGNKTLSKFYTDNMELAIDDLNKMYCVIKGIR